MDTAPGPAPACRALKITASAHHEHDELRLRTSAVDHRPARKLHTSGHVNILAKNCTSHAKLPEVWVNKTVRPSGITTLSQRAATVRSRREPPQPEPEKPARPAHQRHQPLDKLLGIDDRHQEHAVHGKKPRKSRKTATVPHLRHRCIENLHHKSIIGRLLHGALLILVLRPPRLTQAESGRDPPGSSSYRWKSSGWGGGCTGSWP